MLYPLGCVADYKLDDDISALRAEPLQNIMCYFSKLHDIKLELFV